MARAHAQRGSKVGPPLEHHTWGLSVWVRVISVLADLWLSVTHACCHEPQPNNFTLLFSITWMTFTELSLDRQAAVEARPGWVEGCSG